MSIFSKVLERRRVERQRLDAAGWEGLHAGTARRLAAVLDEQGVSAQQFAQFGPLGVGVACSHLSRREFNRVNDWLCAQYARHPELMRDYDR